MAVLASDIKRWLLNAEDAVGATTASPKYAEQIAWLREKRKAYADKAAALDIEITNDSYEGASTQARRGTTNRDEHDAIVGAIERLQTALGTGGESRGTMLGFRINHITG